MNSCAAGPSIAVAAPARSARRPSLQSRLSFFTSRASCRSLGKKRVRLRGCAQSVVKETKLAPGTILMPGVISHATNIVEHPELIARRLVDWAGIVGRENVVGGADCGMGGRVHAEIGWTSRSLTKRQVRKG